MAACQKHQRIFQYGTQQRSQELLKRGIELVLNSYIGDLERIEVWAPPGAGTTFFGPKGWVSLSRDGSEASNSAWLRMKKCEGDKRVPYRNNYYASFVESVRERTPSIAPIEDAVRSGALSHLSLLAIKSGQEVVWDPKAYRILAPEQLKSKMGHQIRGDWPQS